MWDIPRDPIGCIRSAAMSYVVPAASTDVKTLIYMGIRAVLGCSTGGSRLRNSYKNLFIYIGTL
eukprot:4046076-Pleurochrysis_carterae.AAC.1